MNLAPDELDAKTSLADVRIPTLFIFAIHLEEFRVSIGKAMDMWTTHTCVSFVESTPEVAQELGHEHSVLFQTASRG